MKQIFDGIREKMKGFSCEDEDTLGYLHNTIELDDALEIINEAEAKWEADCCEWKNVSKNVLLVQAHGDYKERCEVRKWKFCPDCGKPIKISEVE